MAANGKKTKLKEPVKVRTKKLADGSEFQISFKSLPVFIF